MNVAEIKLDLFRKIDNMPAPDLELLYTKLTALIDSTKKYKLSEFEKQAIEKALEKGAEESFSHSDILNEASGKYRNLRF